MHEALAKANFERDARFLTPRFLEASGWALHQSSFPVLEATFNKASRPLRIRLMCNDWDELPPSIELLNPDGSHMMAGIPGGAFHPGPHRDTGRPFICMRGAREYHTHESHQNDLWGTYRPLSGMNLPGIMTQLDNAWRKAVGV